MLYLIGRPFRGVFAIQRKRLHRAVVLLRDFLPMKQLHGTASRMALLPVEGGLPTEAPLGPPPAISPKLPLNPSVDIIGHALALIAGLCEHLAAIPSVVDHRIGDAACAYKDDKSN